MLPCLVPLILSPRAPTPFACVILGVAGLLVAPAEALAQRDTALRFVGSPGPHAVGLKVIEQYDYSRTYRSTIDELGRPYHRERARPLQTLIWYPAERGHAGPMTVHDYIDLWATETTFGNPSMPARTKDWVSAMKATLATPLLAVRDAEATSGRFPTVVYVPGAFNMSWENADLCEYLASHGYVVIATPTLGARSPSITIDVEGLNTQAQDISFLIGYARTLPNTDVSEIAIAGHSWGGFAGLFAAARDNRIRALVALDGSMRYYPGLLKQVNDVHPEQMTIPLMAFVQRSFSIEDQQRYLAESQRQGPSVLNAWTHGDLITVHMLGLSHAAFTSMYPRREDWWWELAHVWPTWQADYDREDVIAGYAWMARYTLEFLNAYLKHDATALAFLKETPGKNGVAPHVMEVSYRAGTGVPVSFERFRAEIGQKGFDHAADIYAAFRKQKSDFTLDQSALSDWADELITDDHVAQAIAVLTLNVQIHPDSSDAYATLGDAYWQAGQNSTALENYRKAVEKDSLNGAARWKLHELSGVDSQPGDEQ
jgi:dienelactone hydrolase/predicted negative regulator of RcsB-dependent stress response